MNEVLAIFFCFKFVVITLLLQITEVFEWLREKLEFSESVTVNIFTLVLSGWQFVEDSVKCDYCQRKWSLEISDTEEDSGTDPVAQHQKWCAWKKLDHGWESYLDQLLKEKMSEQEGRKRRRTSDHVSVCVENETLLV